MVLKTLELISILLAAFVGGMFWGPWLALTRSMDSFEPQALIAIVRRMNRNMSAVMSPMLPIALVAMIPVLIASGLVRPAVFATTLAGFALFLVALLVTMVIEVPIVKQIATWTVETLPDDWRRLRDPWGAFHVVRVAAAGAGVVLLVAGAVFS
jgi:hypothetical protein